MVRNLFQRNKSKTKHHFFTQDLFLFFFLTKDLCKIFVALCQSLPYPTVTRGEGGRGLIGGLSPSFSSLHKSTRNRTLATTKLFDGIPKQDQNQISSKITRNSRNKIALKKRPCKMLTIRTQETREIGCDRGGLVLIIDFATVSGVKSGP